MKQTKAGWQGLLIVVVNKCWTTADAQHGEAGAPGLRLAGGSLAWPGGGGWPWPGPLGGVTVSRMTVGRKLDGDDGATTDGVSKLANSVVDSGRRCDGGRRCVVYGDVPR